MILFLHPKFFLLVFTSFFLYSCGPKEQHKGDTQDIFGLLYSFREERECPYLFSFIPETEISIRDDDLCKKQKGVSNKATLHIKISNIRNDKNSKINIFIFHQEGTWLDINNAAIKIVLPYEQKQKTLIVKNFPTGTYAIGVFQDLNNNGTLDMQWFPIPYPKEGLGVSGSFSGSLLELPSYQNSSFHVTEKIVTSVSIPMFYYD